MMGKSLDIKNKDIPTTSDVPDQNFKGPPANKTGDGSNRGHY